MLAILAIECTKNQFSMAWFFSDNSGRCYVLPVLWMTSCFFIMDSMAMRIFEQREDSVTGLCHACSSAARVWRDSPLGHAVGLAGCMT